MPGLWPSNIEMELLRLLVSKGESYGLELVRDSGGTVKRGTVYVTLGRMEEKGLVESRQEEVTPNYIGIPRRQYRATGLGERALNAREFAETSMRGEFA